MSEELLTDEDLAWLGSICDESTIKLLRAYESLVQQVETLKGERDQFERAAHAGIRQVATERAAREQAEKRCSSLKGHIESLRDYANLKDLSEDAPRMREKLKQAERERDAALARVKELEAKLYDTARLYAEFSDKYGRCETTLAAVQAERDRYIENMQEWAAAAIKHGQDRDAAETALASALELLTRCLGRTIPPDLRKAIKAFVEQHEERSQCGDPLCDFEDCGLTSHPAPVAAPCAGCAERDRRIAAYERGARERSDERMYGSELEQAIDAAVPLLQRIDQRGGCGLDVHEWLNEAIAALRAAREAGGS